MIHQPLISWWWISGQATDIQIEAEEMLKVKKMLIGITAQKTWRKEEEVERDMERNKRLTAHEAKEYGLIDHVIGKL